MNFKLTKKQLIPGGIVLTGALCAGALVLIKNRTAAKKDHKLKKEELSNIINELEVISDKIIELTKSKEHLDKLEKQKQLLKDNFLRGPL